MAIKEGDTVKVEYVGLLDDGSVFDASETHGQPLEFTVGGGNVIKGFDDAVRGLEVGEEKEFRLEPEDAYGEYKDALIDTVSRDLVKSSMEMEVGKTFWVQAPHGQTIPAKIIDLTEDEVTFDLNHPLAGKALTFKIIIVEA
ncbi:FKBP-type peptidyl-prolyl cis-trans isomerase [Methanolobus bombayensis]|uniref:FKBP-type peptidyl-prolyl cis-trans isomerase n=1 Tax=Methanolobus bombayensis TaxID=38023 RepID=UPI001AE87A85|nr:peptidylprolyl isomerase [Methanolobus bombayensis]MBP1908460.1 FKBP-type peptidyl-prolyl cis-trans isomerase 2 [Methanolobus bombayensis]